MTYIHHITQSSDCQTVELSFDAIYEKHYERIYKKALSLLKSPEDAQDATQETFLRLHLSDIQFINEEFVKRWLFRVVINLCIDILRHRSSVAKVESCYYDETLDRGYEHDYTSVEAEDIVKRALAYVRKQDRSTLLAIIKSESSVTYAARLECVSVDTYKARLYRVRETLRSHRSLIA